MVFSDDPETGLAGPREVLATWPNTDSLAEFGVGGRAGTCSLLRPDPKPTGGGIEVVVPEGSVTMCGFSITGGC